MAAATATASSASTEECGRLSLTLKLSFALPTLAALPVQALLSLYAIPLYERNGARLEHMVLFIALARSIDVVSDPLMSYITDSCRSKYGRRRPFMATGCPGYGLCLLLLLWPPYLDEASFTIWFGSFYLLFYMFNTYTNIPYDALGPELTSDYEARSSLFFFAGIVDGFGALIAMMAPFMLSSAIAKTTWNEHICLPSDVVAAVCASGASCESFAQRGADAEFVQVAATLIGSEIVMNTTRRPASDCMEVLADPCQSTCELACNIANERSGFMALGVFFSVWYITTMLHCVWRVRERCQGSSLSQIVPTDVADTAHGPKRQHSKEAVPLMPLDPYRANKSAGPSQENSQGAAALKGVAAELAAELDDLMLVGPHRSRTMPSVPASRLPGQAEQGASRLPGRTFSDIYCSCKRGDKQGWKTSCRLCSMSWVARCHCGSILPDDASFCQKCGQPRAVAQLAKVVPASPSDIRDMPMSSGEASREPQQPKLLGRRAHPAVAAELPLDPLPPAAPNAAARRPSWARRLSGGTGAGPVAGNYVSGLGTPASSASRLPSEDHRAAGPRGFPAPMPMVPSIMNALRNPAFTVLLPAWACDALVVGVFQSVTPYYIRYVIRPEYQTLAEHGLDCCSGLRGLSKSSDFNWRCSSQYVLGGCVVMALMCAVIATPIWLLIMKRVGKVQAWLTWSLTMAVSNILYCFLGAGDIYGALLVCGVNGAPLGAKFLADAILADIIDYDEFLTGTRKEATYTMFRSFLPKLIAIPAAALPIVFMNTLGHVAPVNGSVQQQPAAVVYFLGIGLPIFVSCTALFSWHMKRSYPLRTKEMVNMVASGIKEHEEGRSAIDPISERMYELPRVVDEDLDKVHLLNHFLHERFGLPQALSDVATELVEWQASWHIRLYEKCMFQLVAAVILLLVSALLTVLTLPLLSEQATSFIPSIALIIAGSCFAFFTFAALRFRAARRITVKMGGRRDVWGIVVEVVKHRDELALLRRQARRPPPCCGLPRWRSRGAEQRAGAAPAATSAAGSAAPAAGDSTVREFMGSYSGSSAASHSISVIPGLPSGSATAPLQRPWPRELQVAEMASVEAPQQSGGRQCLPGPRSSASGSKDGRISSGTWPPMAPGALPIPLEEAVPSSTVMRQPPTVHLSEEPTSFTRTPSDPPHRTTSSPFASVGELLARSLPGAQERRSSAPTAAAAEEAEMIDHSDTLQ